ncbi:flagellar FliL protein [Rhodovulum bhavnagarense]|uniref:Flagellar protein FliL n=1 Tax=Rhodovulum bhavnagarense TaxID=992286 RepID=A0A4R2RFG3_9RHOB|nr:flagellar basal body-associated FliL family protein [Rhodovulum bhavnagarense]TCP61384.1 flagellar FliL protein [Rhodovulum bhavnagarense]
MTDKTDGKTKKSPLKLILLALGALAFSGGGFAAGQFMSGPKLSPSEEVLRLIESSSLAGAAVTGGSLASGEARPNGLPTLYHEFPEPLLSNLAGSRRFLQVGVGIATRQDEQVIAHLVTHEMALRSDMLGVISGFSEEDIAGTEGRTRLADAIKTAINTRLEQLTGRAGIEDVFFKSFVLQ